MNSSDDVWRNRIRIGGGLVAYLDTTHWPSITRYQGTCPPPSATRPGVPLPCSPIGYQGPPSSLRRASPSGHSVRPTVWHEIFFIRFTTYGHFHPFSKKFIHCPENASTFQKINPLLRNFILYREISSSVQKVHLLHNKFILFLPNSSTMPFLEWGYM
jgi:hypothetical protein